MTNRQNDKNNDSLSIAEEILSELKANDPAPEKEEAEAKDETTSLNEEETSAPIIEETEEKDSSKKIEIPRKTDSLSEEIISLDVDEVQEDNTDEFIIPASDETDSTPETTESFSESQPQKSEEIKEEKISRYDDFALPPTFEEKRNGARNTKVMSPDNNDSDSTRHDDLALPPTFEEKRSGARNTKVMSPDHDDSDDFIFTKYKKNSSHSSKKRTSKKHKKSRTRFRDKPFWKKLLIILGWIFGVIIGLLLLLVIAFFISSCIGKKQLTNYEDVNIVPPIIEGASISSSNNGKIQEYNGTTYKLNEDITTILCLGVDKYGLGTENDLVGTAGQADAIYLVAIDTKTGKTDIIGVPRDIVTDIGIYSTSGEYLRTEKTQLCLAYAYGDGFETSCENTKTAVERLFNNLKIQSYFAIDIEAIAQLNDAVGGVTVTMKDDFFRSLNYGVQTRHYTGEVVTLDGDNAIRYVQQREVAYLESASERMDRQINYLQAFSSKVLDMTKKDLGIPVDLFNIVSDNSVTDLNINKISYLAKLVIDPGISTLNFTKIPGELTSDGTYAIYEVDTQAFYEQFLDIFFIPQN